MTVPERQAGLSGLSSKAEFVGQPGPDSPSETESDDGVLIVVSSDSHVSPRADSLRPYCPKGHLSRFDREVAMSKKLVKLFGTSRSISGMFCLEPKSEAYDRALETLASEGNFEIEARLRDMDADGVAASVIFHGAQVAEMLPFAGTSLRRRALPDTRSAQDLIAVGLHMYNAWLADQCTIEPERNVGLAHIPIHDIDASIREVEWAANAGLKGVNFPAPRPGLLGYDDPAWEHFWSACEANDLVLVTHSGPGVLPTVNPDLEGAYTHLEGAAATRSTAWRLVFGGVFERHPKLKLVLTEAPGDWLPWLIRELDRTFHLYRASIARRAPRLPSEYCKHHLFIGASCLAPYEAMTYLRERLVENVMWGSDYPHVEGTWCPTHEGETPMTRLSLRNTFAQLPSVTADAIRAMVGETAMRVFGLDQRALAIVAARIRAPTVTELSTPIEAIPPHAGPYAFRQL